MEEIDLCWRLKNMGYRIMACPQSTVYHVGGGTLKVGNPHKTYLNFRNNLYLLIKNESGKTLVFSILWRMVLDGIAGLRFLTQGHVKHFWAIIRGHFTFYGNFRKFSRKRKELKKRVVNYSHPEILNRSIVYAFFVKGCKTYNTLVK